MLTPEEQMQLLKEALVQGYKGPIYKLIDEANIRKGVTAQTESQQKQGLLGSDGNTAMAFPNSDNNFNTEGMDFPIDVRKYDKEGNLVRSYNKVPPGIKELDMGEEEGTVIETPSQYQKGGVKETTEEYNARIMAEYYNRLQEHSDSTASYNKAVIIDDLYNEGQDIKNEALKVMLDAIKYKQEDPVAFDKEHGCGKGFFRDARGKCIEGNIKGSELIKEGKILEEDLRKTGIYPTEKKKLVNTGDSEYTYTTTAESIKPGPVPKKPMEKITSIGPELLSILNKEPKVEKSKRKYMRTGEGEAINLETGETWKRKKKKDGTWVGRQFKKLINRGPGKRRGPTNLVTGQPGELGELGYKEGGVKKRKGETYVVDKTAVIKNPVMNTKQFSDVPMYEGQKHSTHLMTWGEGEGGKFHAWPTIFQDDSGNWYKGDIDEAVKKGEVQEFDTAEEAEAFADGSWKDTYQIGGIKAQGFSNIQVPGIHWAEGIEELKHISPGRQGVNVSGLNLSKNFKLGKNLNLNLSNPAAVYARPTIDNMPGKGSFKAFPFEPKVGLTYNFQKGGIAIKSEKKPIKINSYQEGGSKIPEGLVFPPGFEMPTQNITYTSDKIEESRKAPWHSNLIQGSQPTPGGDYSLPSVPTWRKFETSKIGKAINAKRFRIGKDRMFEDLGYEKGRQLEGTVDALNWLPYAGEAIDAYSTVEDLTNKDYLGATLSATGFALPFVPGRAVKKGFNKLKDKTKSLYRVVDAPNIETARKYAGTVGGTGRRTGSEMTRIQQTTPFDHISTTTDQSWILGNKNIVGGDNLFDRYGGENPFVARLKPRTTNVATTYGKNVDELAKIPPGSITDMNVTGPGGQNITNIMGPKGSEVLDVEEVLSKADYLKRHNIDPNFKWGVRASPDPVGEGKKVYRSTYLKSLLKGERTREEKEEKARGEYVTKLGTYEDENIKRKGGSRKYQIGGFNFNKKFDYSSEAIKERQENIDWKGIETFFNFAPYTGEVIDAKNTIQDLKKGNYSGAALNAAGFLIPFVPGGILKKGVGAVKKWAKKFKKEHKIGEHSKANFLENVKSTIKKDANTRLEYYGNKKMPWKTDPIHPDLTLTEKDLARHLDKTGQGGKTTLYRYGDQPTGFKKSNWYSADPTDPLKYQDDYSRGNPNAKVFKIEVDNKDLYKHYRGGPQQGSYYDSYTKFKEFDVPESELGDITTYKNMDSYKKYLNTLKQKGGFNFDPISSEQDQTFNQTQQIRVSQDKEEFNINLMKDLQELDEWDFKDKYNTNKHTIKRYIDPVYRQESNRRGSETAKKYGSVQSYYDKFKGQNPYNQWISGASNQMYASPEQKQITQDYHQNWIGAALPIPVLEGINLTSKGARIPGLSKYLSSSPKITSTGKGKMPSEKTLNEMADRLEKMSEDFIDVMKDAGSKAEKEAIAEAWSKNNLDEIRRMRKMTDDFPKSKVSIKIKNKLDKMNLAEEGGSQIQKTDLEVYVHPKTGEIENFQSLRKGKVTQADLEENLSPLSKSSTLDFLKKFPYKNQKGGIRKKRGRYKSKSCW